jgi:molybdopterin-guanine dinucleotide biosynthesis adapter protein
MVPVIIITGPSGSGKTLLLERLIPELAARKVTVAVVKHTRHPAEVDLEGKDTWRFSQAGARVVALSSPTLTALLRRRPTPLAELLPQVAEGVDLVLVEGFKGEKGFPRIVVLRQGAAAADWRKDPDVAALAADHPFPTDLPLLPLNDPAAVAAFILGRFLPGFSD